MHETFAIGSSVEVWLAGWDRWYRGEVTQTGYLEGLSCVAVLFPDKPCASVYRIDQVRPLDTTGLQTARLPMGGLFAP